MKHFVPRLVLRRFADKLTVYNVKSGELLENQKIEKIFGSDDIYSDDLEFKLNSNIEGKFGDILNHKILNAKEVCELKRDEVETIKKFLLIAMLRTQYVSTTLGKMRFFSESIQKKYKELGMKLPFNEKFIENESIYERWIRIINVILESSNLYQVINHEQVTFEAWRWAQIFNCGYLSIWDNAYSSEDFIITDVGMTSESDMPIFIRGISNKQEYLLNMLKNEKTINKNLYKELLFYQENFHEHYFMFSISKNRTIVLINPFFSLYDKFATPNLPIPNIWPCYLKERSLFEKHTVDFKNSAINGDIVYSNEDILIFRIKNLSSVDAIFLNLLMLDRIDNLVGFADLERVKNSLLTYSKHPGQKVNYHSLIRLMKEKGIY